MYEKMYSPGVTGAGAGGDSIPVDVISDETAVDVAIIAEALEPLGISVNLTPRLPRLVKFAERHGRSCFPRLLFHF